MENGKPIESIYELDAFETILRDSIHPGGLKLTEHLAETAEIFTGSMLLDVACGKGTSAEFLSRSFGCRVIGIDSSANMIKHSLDRSRETNRNTMFLRGEGQHLPFMERSFDFVLFECTFSIFENKNRVSDEAYRVLKPGGKLAMTDLYLKEGTSVELSKSVFPCAAGALTEKEYFEVFRKAGFGNLFMEDHSKELRKIYIDIMFEFGSMANFCNLISKASQTARMPESLPVLFDGKHIEMKGKLAYGLFVCSKS